MAGLQVPDVMCCHDRNSSFLLVMLFCVMSSVIVPERAAMCYHCVLNGSPEDGVAPGK
jgi:hypothetical protein